jgi:NAD-dependent dihydropyrimidine dehydrogenase PreA subunit
LKDAQEDTLFPKPVVEENRCLRSSPGRSRCTACREVCPIPGFHLNDGTVTLPDGCISCHLCTAACSEGAIRGILPPSRLLSQTEIVLNCERVNQHGGTPISCVGAIPKAFLEVAAVRKSSVQLVTGPCKQCECRIGLALCEKRITQIRENRPLLLYRSERPFGEAPERRRLLRWLGRSLMPFRMGASDYRNLLSEEFVSETDRIRPVFTDHCIGCPVCEIVCPHRVFQRDETDLGVRFRVIEQRCTDCKKCVESCSFQGVTLENTSKRGVRRVELRKQRCPGCKEIFYGQANACPRCRNTGTRGLFDRNVCVKSIAGVQTENEASHFRS